MEKLVYSSEIAKKILDRFHEKGWNLYRSDVSMGEEQIIRQHLANSLQVGERYTLLPAVDNPKDPKQVFDALETLAQRLDRKMPTIRVGNEYHPLTGITLKEDGIKIHTPEGTFVSYMAFMKALDSVIQTR